MFQNSLSLLSESLLETLAMTGVAGILTLLAGLPLGIVLFATRRQQFLAKPVLWSVLSFVVNITRSIPFVILMVAVIPLTRFLTGTSIGTVAAMVPLTLCAIPFFARVTENTLLEVNSGLIETATVMGATHWQLVTKILLPESLAGLINGMTLTLINLAGYSSMAGAVGGGGLGDLAIRYGYERPDMTLLLAAIIIMVLLIQAIQWAGDQLASKFAH
jgi:D-methionine transport system permease protein